jgi:hypothetical protein
VSRDGSVGFGDLVGKLEAFLPRPHPPLAPVNPAVGFGPTLAAKSELPRASDMALDERPRGCPMAPDFQL